MFYNINKRKYEEQEKRMPDVRHIETDAAKVRAVHPRKKQVTQNASGSPERASGIIPANETGNGTVGFFC